MPIIQPFLLKIKNKISKEKHFQELNPTDKNNVNATIIA